MKAQEGGGSRRVQRTVLSVVAAAVPIVSAFVFPDALADYAALMWLLLLVPAFLWAYDRGWVGVATALAFGMAVLSITYAVAEYTGRALPNLLFGVVVAYVAITLGIGVFGQQLAEAQPEGALDASALQDGLTGLANRLHADMHLTTEFAAASSNRRPLTLVLFGLDQLDEYVARHGRSAREEALRSFAAVLRRHTRHMNVSARYTGEEFLSILGGTPEDGAIIFAGRLQEHLRQHSPPLPTVSIGVAAYRVELTTPEALVQAAAAALAEARRDGGDRVRVHGRALAELARPLPEMVQPGQRASVIVAARALPDHAALQALRVQHAAALERVTGTMAHDYNNLLAAMMGNAELLLERMAGDAAARREAEEILQAAERASTLTRRLLACAGRQRYRVEAVDVNELVREHAPLLRETAGADIDIVLDLTEGVSAVRADRAHLAAALLELAANARAAMPQGGTLKLTTASRTVSSHDDVGGELQPGRYTEIRVTDTGSGMSPDVLRHAFEPFFTMKPREPGVGLGLSMVQGIVKQVGGHVRLESQPERGTDVVMWLPVHAADGASAARAEAPR